VLLRRGDYPAAATELKAAVALSPAGRWPNFYSGICAYRMGKFDDAVAAFSVSIGSDPDRPEFFHNRSQAYRALGRWEDARRDSDRAAAAASLLVGESEPADKPTPQDAVLRPQDIRFSGGVPRRPFVRNQRKKNVPTHSVSPHLVCESDKTLPKHRARSRPSWWQIWGKWPFGNSTGSSFSTIPRAVHNIRFQDRLTVIP
jgi:hypothetical protein